MQGTGSAASCFIPDLFIPHLLCLQDQPATIPSNSCRKGLVVHLVNAMGMQVPVRIKLSALAASDGAALYHVVQVGGGGGMWELVVCSDMWWTLPFVEVQVA